MCTTSSLIEGCDTASVKLCHWYHLKRAARLQTHLVTAQQDESTIWSRATAASRRDKALFDV